jgi:glycosyltransferase involved in cell wall biosynthesis
MILASPSFSTGAHTAHPQPSVLIALPSLCAEGTPVLALELCRLWQSWGIRPIIATLYDQPNDLQSEFEALSIPVHSLHLPQKGYLRYLKMATGIYRLAFHYRATAFLSMLFGWHTFMSVGAKLAGVQHIAAHVGSYPPYDSPSFHKFRWQVRWGRSVCGGLICCSQYVQAGVVKHFGLTETEVLTIYNACGFQVSDVVERTPNASAVPTVGMVARLDKDQPTLIKAADILKQRGTHIEVQLIGEGRCRQEFEQLTYALGVSDRVHFLGMRRDIPELLSQLDIFVFAVNPEEGFGMALVEAMMAGVPVIASNVGGCAEVLEDGDLGILVTKGDATRLADAIQYLLTHPQQSQKLAQHAQQAAQENFSMETMAHHYATYLRLLP